MYFDRNREETLRAMSELLLYLTEDLEKHSPEAARHVRCAYDVLQDEAEPDDPRESTAYQSIIYARQRFG